MDSPFMEYFAKGLGRRGFRVARLEFPYMAARRETGRRKPPDREPILRETWLEVVRTLGTESLIIGGKSMGGRIASLVADEAGVAALVCLGYPFHPVSVGGRLWRSVSVDEFTAAIQPSGVGSIRRTSSIPVRLLDAGVRRRHSVAAGHALEAGR